MVKTILPEANAYPADINTASGKYEIAATYDKAGNVLSQTDANSNKTEMTYDGLEECKLKRTLSALPRVLLRQ